MWVGFYITNGFWDISWHIIWYAFSLCHWTLNNIFLFSKENISWCDLSMLLNHLAFLCIWHDAYGSCRRAFIDELALLQKMRHPNVVQFLGAVTQSTPMMIVTEYLPKVCPSFIELITVFLYSDYETFIAQLQKVRCMLRCRRYSISIESH